MRHHRSDVDWTVAQGAQDSGAPLEDWGAMPTMWFQGQEPPRCLAHPGSSETVDVRSLRGALVAALTPANLRAWHELVGNAYSAPSFEPGEPIDLDDVALIVNFIDGHLEDAAAEAARIAATAPGLALSGFRSPASTAAELVKFIRAARRWLDSAQRHGGPALVREELATIIDPAVRHDVELRQS